MARHSISPGFSTKCMSSALAQWPRKDVSHLDCAPMVMMLSFRFQLLIGVGRRPSLHQCEDRLPFFDDVCRELSRGAATDVPCRMDRASRNKEDVACLERHWRFSLDLILK